jgi:fatty acid desaturase
MEELKKKLSMLRLDLELLEQFIALVFLELKLAVLEIRRNIRSMEKGAIFIAIGAFILLFAMMTLIGTAVAALAMVFPVWLAALIVALLLTFFGTSFLFTGLGKLKHFSLVPSETLQRVRTISKQLKKHADRHKQ